ncbi:Flp pilus assembly complex ATPase component TadA [Patescibacteria group bacterium]|nr:hypothetical protein [Candidatus Falkowbacteria bacterium]MBU3906315.1 Flp pilus assembly complex ATPase component TadA [Patescibacteria group bacterium]MCG2698276.1 Flp pilus assembly complex ATPase component TadA [Candidatus Parcubacteria bacterium]MBU4015598.1 Flp pilus assembly complex ATPase component TadA [Patescibacteria group bacterium]MBU4027134.1 Flp pilus assembly complex ATPase component TadA [Patescibacteria group bacterium]
MEIPSIYLNRILSEAAKKSASSFHLSVGSLPMMRINDQLFPMPGESIATSETLNKIIQSLLSQDEQAKLHGRRGIVLVKIIAGNFRFRVNIFYQKDMPALSFHYIPGAIKSLAELKLPKVLRDFINFNYGLLIIAGPFSSGKTTTAVSFIEEINNASASRVITIEDPIEYLFVNKKSVIEQRQVGRDVKSVKEGVNYCMEEDVDLVFIGEIRKDFSDVIPPILELAAGNCLVVLEINSDSSVRVAEKILSSLEKNMSAQAARYSFADVLNGIIVQKLMRCRGGGMALATEVLLANPAIKSLIRENKIYQFTNVMQTFREEGMISMEKAVEELVKSGDVQG